MKLDNLIQKYVPKSIRHAAVAGLLLTSMAATSLAACTMPPSPTPYVSPTPTIEPSPTPTFTPTPTPIPVYGLSGRVFFDYNGNGLWDEGGSQSEPPIQGVPVCVDSLEGALCSKSSADGSYLIRNIPGGSHKVYVKSPTQEPATAFRYINKFLGWVDISAYEMNGVSVPQHLADTEAQPISQPLRVNVNKDQSLDVALMQGFLTLPFNSDNPVTIHKYFDLDRRPCAPDTQDFNQCPERRNYLGNKERVYDQHTGIDFQLQLGTPIIAGAPGNIIQITIINEESRYRLWIDHGNGWITLYDHLQSDFPVEPEDFVERGQIIGYVDQQRYPFFVPIHIHFDLRSISGGGMREPGGSFVGGYRDGGAQDIFRDIFYFDSLSYWTVDNNPKFSK